MLKQEEYSCALAVHQLMKTKVFAMPALEREFNNKLLTLIAIEDIKYKEGNYILLIKSRIANDFMVIPFIWKETFKPSIQDALRRIRMLSQVNNVEI